MTVLTNGIILTPNQQLANHSVIVDGDRIVAVSTDDAVAEQTVSNRTTANLDIVDVDGAYIMPGAIDIHSDYIEYIAAPRPTSMMDFSLALREAERQLITHGITTMFHSISFYNFTEFARSPIRRPENTRRMIDAIRSSHRIEHIIHHRFHARIEIDSLDRIEEIERYLEEGSVDLLSFMDHTPGQGQYRNLEIYRETLKGYRNLSEEEIDRTIAHSQGREKMTTELIARLSALAAARGVAVASHDDDSIAKVDLVKSLGGTICEFPVAVDIARYARGVGLHTVAGAPNVLLGGSHSGNLSAAAAVGEQAVDILCSDYFPAAMLHAVFRLSDDLGIPLFEAVKLITLNPARAARVDGDTGSIEAGKRADIIVVDKLSDGSPAVSRALVSGVSVYSSSYRAPVPEVLSVND